MSCTRGHDLVETGEGERIIAVSIKEKFVTGPDGELESLTTGSIRPVALTATHAGIVKVKRYAFSMP